MVVIGVVLMAAAIGFSIDVFVQNTTDIDIDVFGRTFVVAPGWLVVAGIVAVVAFLVGVRLVAAGVTRARGRRRALRAAVGATQERDRLAEQLVVERAEREHAARETIPSPAAQDIETAEPKSAGGVVPTSN